jgi:predicted phosphodiesterase
MKQHIQTTVVLPDIHYPQHDEASVSAVMKFIEWQKPNRIVLLGDAMNMDAVNHWRKEKGNLKAFENKRLKEDYEEFDSNILKPLEKLSPHAEKIYMGGNHEDWANVVTDQSPNLTGLVEPEICLNLKKRGWKWIPYILQEKGTYSRGKLIIGKLLLVHGHYVNMYHAAKTANAYSMSCIYGHTHDIQLHTKVTVDDPRGYHTAQSIGCLCNLAPDYMKGQMNRWVHAFAVIYTLPSGHFTLYVPIIIKGKFTFAGKVFDGNK